MGNYILWLSKLLTLLVIFLVGVPLLIGIGVGTLTGLSKESGKVGSDHGVAVVELIGEIEDTKDIVNQLYEAAEDSSIDGIILRVDSPGGAVAPSQDIYQAVDKLKHKKPIIASMGSLAASGGFYASIAASKIFAQPGTMTGSIGVIMQIPNITKISQLIGFDMVTIKSGKLKDSGNMFRAMTDEEQQYLQNTASTVHNQFIADIAKARNLSVDSIKEYADGRVILGEQAKSLGLIDGFGDIHTAAEAIYELKGKPLPENKQPNLIYHDDKFKELKKLLKTASLIPKMFISEPSLKYQVSF